MMLLYTASFNTDCIIILCCIHGLSLSLSLSLSLLPLQTNVYDGAQRRKMSYFEGFTKKAVIVVPPHHVLRQRTAKRNSEMGEPVPDDAINAMKGRRSLECVCVCVWGGGGGGGGGCRGANGGREREREFQSDQ